jgi:hypothetical protein
MTIQLKNFQWQTQTYHEHVMTIQFKRLFVAGYEHVMTIQLKIGSEEGEGGQMFAKSYYGPPQDFFAPWAGRVREWVELS